MKRVYILIYFIFAGAGVFAQSLNLEQARVLALANSRSLARYELAIRSSILDERSQLYTMLPQVSAGYAASVNYLYNWEFVNPADTFSAWATLSVTQILFQGGKGFIQKAIANIATESTRKDALAEYFNVLDSVDNAYYAVLEAAATLEAEESSLQAAQLSYSIAEVRQSTGMINAGDYLKAMADKEARENSYNQARRNLALNEARLRSLTGITGAVTLEQIDMSSYERPLLRLSSISDEDAGFLYDEFWKILAESNPSLARAALSSERAERNLSLARRDYTPVISATIFAAGLDYGAAAGFKSSSSGGITIRGSIPLDFWVLNNRLEKSAIARDSAAIDYINAYSSLETDLQSALLNIYAQAGSVLSSRRSLEYTEKHYEFVMERYRLSLSSVSDLTDASSLYIASRNNHIKATYSFLQSLSKLRSMCAMNDESRLIELLLGGGE
ncbi:MAG: TolC family protein [Treponema sp.]|jgi:outer membrane protein TolC|nr:TolC family protein [Treponema sp.]